MSATRGADEVRVPRPVRFAALGVAAEGLAALAAAVALVVVAGLGSVAVWGFLVLLGAAVTAAGVALFLGQRGARGPSLVAQLILLGIAFYAGVPSGRPEWGVPAALLAALVLAGLLSRESREWAGS